MKKFIFALAALSLAFSSAAFAAYKDGTYTGKGEGRGGALKVQVVVEGGKITSVKVLRHSDTDAIMEGALAEIPAAIIEKNSPDVNAVGGATASSEGIKQAVADALKKAQ
jgi:fumarate reductase flavoprotein subunit